MGVVYKAEDTKLRRTVALKFLPPELTRDKSAKTRFVHEAQAASALQHNNICTIHEIDETRDGRMFICMDCYDGETLRDRIARGPIPIDKAVDIAAQVADGLAEAHKAGMVHRDIKPANIVITKNGVVKILDFGLAKLAGMTKVTRTGMTVGTVAYMSPEQARGADVDRRSDVWSLGVVLYELLAGKTPFRGDHEAAVLYAIQNIAPEPVSNVHVTVPPELESIISDAMAKDPSNRPDSMGELARRLRAFRQKTVSSQRATGARSVWISPRRRGILAIGVITLVALIAFAWSYVRTPEADAIGSIAVLPLDNLTGDPEQEYFVDGMTEVLTARMAQNSTLKVISRTSAMRFKDSEKSLPEIADELGVDAVIEGSIFRSGDSVRVTAQLIDARNDVHMWSNTYDRNVRDVLAMQSEIAQAIFGEVHIRLTPDEKRELTDVAQIDPQALESYLRGRFLLNKRTRSGELRASLEQFEKTIELEPEYAPAHAALASAYSLLAERVASDLQENVIKAQMAARRALEMDERQAEAIAVLANIAYVYDWDWSASEKLFRQALAIDPNDASTHTAFCEMLRCQGRFEEALSEIHAAQTLDPLSPMTSVIKAWTLNLARRYEDAIAQSERALEMDDKFYLPCLIIASSQEELGDHDAAMKWIVRHARLTGESEEAITELESTYDSSGHEGINRFYLEKVLQEERKTGRKKWYSRAFLYTRLGDTNKGIESLEKALDTPMFYLTMVAVSPVWDPLRSDPRFDKILERMGLKDYAIDPNTLEPREP
jgi:serine/threonine protein kinase/Tfp pilus assembly protein PilF